MVDEIRITEEEARETRMWAVDLAVAFGRARDITTLKKHAETLYQFAIQREIPASVKKLKIKSINNNVNTKGEV